MQAAGPVSATFTAPAGDAAGLDESTFVVSDGERSVTFEFDDVFAAFAAGGSKYGTGAAADWTPPNS